MALQALWLIRSSIDDKQVETKKLYNNITYQLNKIKTALDTCDLTIQRNRDYIRTYFNNVKKLAASPQGRHMPSTMERITQQIEILEQEFNNIMRLRENIPNIKKDVVYAVVPAYDYCEDADMCAVVFVTTDKQKAYAMNHYLNNTLKDPVMLHWILQMGYEGAQDAVQKCISVEKFKMIEYNKKKLEEFYDRMKNIYHDGMKNPATIVYVFLSIEGMINQTDPTKIEGSSVNDRFWDKDTLEEIRRTFNDKYIV